MTDVELIEKLLESRPDLAIVPRNPTIEMVRAAATLGRERAGPYIENHHRIPSANAFAKYYDAMIGAAPSHQRRRRSGF